MALTFKIRDFLRPRRDIIKEVGIKEGFHMLDYGCGPGSYLSAVADLVGKSGKIYALDTNPQAIKAIEKIAAKKQLTNVEAILSDCDTGLPDASIDVALLYDTFHDLIDQNAVLKELRRVLKPNGILSFNDHHMKDSEILSKVTDDKLFRLLRRGERTYSFVKYGAH
jgi:ubiquinone/menaquinone biosynthesis C-methylase UbiE